METGPITSMESLLERWDTLSSEKQVNLYNRFATQEDEEAHATSDTTIRPYHTKDEDIIFRLRQTMLGSVANPNLFDLTVSENQNESLVIAELKGKVVGYALTEKGSQSQTIHEIVVDSEYRRLGVMSDLLAHIVDGPTDCLILKDNNSAQMAFERNGFTRTNVRGNYIEMERMY